MNIFADLMAAAKAAEAAPWTTTIRVSPTGLEITTTHDDLGIMTVVGWTDMDGMTTPVATAAVEANIRAMRREVGETVLAPVGYGLDIPPRHAPDPTDPDRLP